MANFIGVLDPDPGRREAFRDRVRGRVAFLPGLLTGEVNFGRLTLVWAVGSRAPLSTVESPEGVAVVFGDAIPGPGPERADGAALLAGWMGADTGRPSAFDGYYAAVAYRPEAGLRLGADILGMFPLYYWHAGEVTLFGSSAALFAEHPAFRATVDPQGVAGILTLNGLVAGRTVLEGVHRVGAGRVLAVADGQAPRQLVQYDVPDSDRYVDAGFAAHLEVLDHAMGSTLARHAPAGQPVGLLLSGGQDSRLLGGYLQRQGPSAVAFTMGVRRDIEVVTARQVARALGFEHQVREIDPPDPAGAASLTARWEHVSNGFFWALDWALPSILQDFPSRMVNGYALDMLLAPKKLGNDFSGSSEQAFIAALSRQRRWGLPPADVAALLGDPRVVEQALEELRAEFVARSSKPVRMRWKHNLANRTRYHLGSAAWHICFGSWPVLPVLDRELIDTVASLPVATISGRWAERELLRTRFPHLARLPLDRNSHDTTPIEPPTLFLVRQALGRRLHRLTEDLGLSIRRRERRRYFRIADFNRHAWRLVRQVADQHRSATAAFLDPAALDRILPRADVTVQASDMIIETAGLKSLAGLTVWAGSRS